jgi:hypothetical protein
MTSSNNQYSSRKFSPTKAHSPCPICDDIKGKCRIVGDDFVLCMTHPTDGAIAGWHYLGETTGSYYAGKYGRNRQESAADRESRREVYLKQLIAQQKAQRERLTKLPDAAQRDRLYQDYLQKIGLNDTDKQDLLDRGLSEQEIIDLGVKSTNSGYILPICNISKQIIGFQMRLRVTNSGRYRWHKPLRIDAHQKNGELPLAFHGDRQIECQRIILVEGTGVKPYLAAKLRGCPAIGASGGQFVASQKTLQTYLDNLGANPELTRLEYAIDAGDIANPSVMRRHEKNLDFIADLGYGVDLLWWGQFTKDDDDIDELDRLTGNAKIQILTVAQFFAIAEYQTQSKYAPYQWLKEKIFPHAKAQSFARSLPIEPPVVNYSAETRLETWQNSLQNHHDVLDASATGGGKSHYAGLLRPEMFEDIHRIIYVSNDSRNVTTETLENWPLLPARHSGLISKNGKLRRAKQDSELYPKAIDIKANCSRTRAIAALRNKAIADTSIVCKTCPMLNTCRHDSGDGYGFKHERAQAFKSKILRSHPASLPSPDEYNYGKTILIWEEVSESLKTMRQISVSRTDIDAMIAQISRSPIDHKLQIMDVLNKLHHLLGDQSRYGLDFHSIKATISEIIDTSSLQEILKPDLSILDTIDGIADAEFEKAKGKDKQELVRINSLLKRATTLKPSEIEQKIEQEILKQWLPEFLDILGGSIKHGDLHIHKGVLTVSLTDPRLREIANQAASNLYLDATMQSSELKLRLGSEIHLVKQSSDLLMPTIYQVADIGRLSMQRGGGQSAQAEVIVKHLKQVDPTTMVIDFKKFATADGVWFRDSRGSNDFKNAQTMVVIGTPCSNIASLRAEYVILTGKHPKEGDRNFAAFINRHILANIQQCFGRKSGNRFRTGDKIYFLSNFNLGDIPHVQIKAKDVTPEAMSSRESLELQILQKVDLAIAEGFDLWSASQRKLADWLGLKRGTFIYHAKWINPLLRTIYSNLIQNLNENPNNNLDSCQNILNDPSDRYLVEFWAGETENLLADPVPIRSTLAGLMEFFGQYIPQYLHRFIFERLSPPSRNLLFSNLAALAICS